MMRYGKSLGVLNWETVEINLMGSAEPEDDQEFLRRMKNGEFIVKREYEKGKTPFLTRIGNYFGDK